MKHVSVIHQFKPSHVSWVGLVSTHVMSLIGIKISQLDMLGLDQKTLQYPTHIYF